MRERLWTSIGSVCLAAVLLTVPAAGAADLEEQGSFLGEPLTGEAKTKIGSVRLEGIDFRRGEKGTDLTITSSAPFMYTSYEMSGDVFVIELPGVKVEGVEDTEVGTPEVSGVVVRSPREVEGSRYARLEIHKGPRGGKAQGKMQGEKTLSVFVPRLAEERVSKNAAAPALLDQASEGEAAGEMGAGDMAGVLEPSRLLDAPAPSRSEGIHTVRMGRRSDDPAPKGPAATMLRDVRIGHAGDALSLELLTDGVVEYSSFELQNPPRLVVDLRGIHEQVRAGAIRVGASGVQKVRISQNQPDPDPVVRVVLDAEGPLEHKIRRQTNGLTIVVGDEAGRAVVPQRRAARRSSGTASDADSLLASAEKLGREERDEDWDRLDADSEDSLYETQLGSPEVPDVPASIRGATPSFEPQVIGGEDVRYTGRPISLDLRNAPIVDIFRLFHELSGLNIVVDPQIGDRTITIDVDNVPWDQVLDLILKTHGLGKTFEGNVLRIAPASKLAQEEREQEALRQARLQAQPLQTVTRTLSYARAQEVEQIIQRIVRSGGGAGGGNNAVSIVDQRTNTLIIRDTRDNIQEINDLIDQLDVPSRQVMIEARIVETQKNFSQEFGIQWGFNYIASPEFGNATDFTFPHSVLIDGASQGATAGLSNPLGGYAVNLPAQSINSAIGISLGNILNTFQLDIALMALETKGKARVISAPRIIAQNNEQANIESGVQIPIVSTTAAEIDVRFVSASLRLGVTPQITREDTVILDLQVENNSPSQVVNVGDVPGITTRQAQTTVLVQNGGTTVIGGIYQVNEGVNQSRVPFLHRIPLLGWLFKNKRRSTDNNELLIFITPRILN